MILFIKITFHFRPASGSPNLPETTGSPNPPSLEKNIFLENEKAVQ